MFSPLRVWAASLQPHRHNSDEEDRDSNFSDLVDASNDKDEERRSGKEEDEESEDGHVSDMDASPLGGSCSECFNACLLVHAFNPIYITVEEEIDSDGFDKDGFDLSRPKIRVRPFPGPCVVHPKFRPYYTNQGFELDNRRIKDNVSRQLQSYMPDERRL